MDRHRFGGWSLGLILCLSCLTAATEPPTPVTESPAASAQDSKKSIGQFVEKLVGAFNGQDASRLAELFLRRGEITDVAGNSYQGREAITQLFAGFFQQFPGATTSMEVNSTRSVGQQLSIVEGTRSVVFKDPNAAGSEQRAKWKLTLVLWNHDGQWHVVSAREEAADLPPSAHDHVGELTWIVGDWIHESPEALIEMTCRWSDDRNYLMVDYSVRRLGKVELKTSQRIGWDPLEKCLRSWTFDSDGGFGEGRWTPTDLGWMIKSWLVLPEGRLGSATMYLKPLGAEQFELQSVDRTVGDEVLEATSVVMTRKPPSPSEGTLPDEKPKGSADPATQADANGHVDSGRGPEHITWELVEVDGQPVAPLRRPATLRLADGAIQAFGGVNRMNASYTLVGDELRFGDIIATKMAGPPEAMRVEQQLSRVLASTARFELDDKGFRLLDRQGRLLARFTGREDSEDRHVDQ